MEKSLRVQRLQKINRVERKTGVVIFPNQHYKYIDPLQKSAAEKSVFDAAAFPSGYDYSVAKGGLFCIHRCN